MKRPQHKKNKPLSPDPKDEAADIDERNLIDAEESADIAFEERVSMYWMENKVFVSSCIAVLALVIIGVNGVRIYGDYAAEKQQSLYQEAKASNTLASYAIDYPTLDLGGFAALQAADAAYEAAAYDVARENYARAVTALKDPVLVSRAQLGHAFATNELGESEAARDELHALVAGPETAGIIRAEALYYLALHAHLENRDDDFANLAEQIEGLGQAGPWQQRLQQLR